MRGVVRTLAIETSCDDTSVAVVSRDGRNFIVEKILAYTQLELHKEYGGVVPELAARSHMEKILPLIEALGGDELRETIDCISVTATPGLPGALVVGVTAAHTLGSIWKKPVIDVNHIMGHVFSILADRSLETMRLPYLCLTVSGGHNDIYLVEQGTEKKVDGIDDDVWHKRHHIPLGGTIQVGPYSVTKCAQTMDDAAGEVFDKVARMLGGPYPGGKRVNDMASAYQGESLYSFTKPSMADDQFSLSGLKSQLYNLTYKVGPDFDEETIQAICAGFSETITQTLAEKFAVYIERFQPETLGLVGGVSANSTLREKIAKLGGNTHFYTPEKFSYCTDNAAMIGVVGLIMHTTNEKM